MVLAIAVSINVLTYFSLLLLLFDCILESSVRIFVDSSFFSISAFGMSSTVGSQTRWDNQLGVFRTSPGDNPAQSRIAQTAALVHFSRIIGFVSEQLLVDY